MGPAGARDPPLGQVYTPAPVAELALSLALDGMPRGVTVLDPACGDGAFLARALAAGIAPDRILGVDVDARALRVAALRAPGVRLQRADFLALAPGEADVVVGNPPYVRQETLGAARKAEIVRALREVWPGVPSEASARLAGRADLALAFVARALVWLRPGGRLAFVLSQAHLEAAYGAALPVLLERAGARLVAVVASRRERWFPDAAVHGAIALVERCPARSPGGPPGAGAGAAGSAAPPGVGAAGAPATGETLVARLSAPVAEAARRARSLEELGAVAELRRAPLSGTLLRAALRAPDAWFEVAAAAGGVLVPLGVLGELRRGSTTGANQFFYLPAPEARRRGIERRFLIPLLKGPRQAPAILVEIARLPLVAFVCPLGEGALARFPGARAHIAAHAALAARPTLAARSTWWRLDGEPARCFLTKAYDVRFAQPFSARPILADQRFYALRPRASGVDEELLSAALNGTLTALALEALGRASLGEGALEWSVGDARALPVLDVRRLAGDRAAAAAVRRAFRRLAARPVGPVADEVLAPDRIALDEALLAIAPPAARRLLGRARRALIAAVADRVARSRPA